MGSWLRPRSSVPTAWATIAVTDMSKSRRPGFTGYQPTNDAFFNLFAELRADRLIP
jgi:hypothetical protein